MEVYVGNYPSSFTEDDLMFFFQDFDGIQLLRFIKRDNKSYCFMKCKNEKQLEDVIKATNNIDVCGRNLIVRENNQNPSGKGKSRGTSVNSSARKEKIHHSIEKHSTEQFEPQRTLANSSTKEEMTRHCNDRNSSDSRQLLKNASESHISIREGNMMHHRRNKNSTGKFKSQGMLENSLTSEEKMMHHCQEPQGREDVQDSCGTLPYANNSSASMSPVQTICPQDTFLKHSPGNKNQVSLCEKFSSLMVRNSPCKKNQVKSNYFSAQQTNPMYSAEYDLYSNEAYHINDFNMQPGEGCSSDRKSNASSEFEMTKEELSFVSVFNFPFGTTHRDLYELFEDFRPVKVWMMCNLPRHDRKTTEAVICFDPSDATDAILTLDNTIYRRRSILVCDAENLSFIPEILTISRKKTIK